MIVSYHDWVAGDLADGSDFYNESDSGIGEYFLESILGDTRTLARTAGIHSKVHGYFRKPGSVFPFGIYYDIEDVDQVRIYAILDQRSDPTWIRRELSGRI